MKLKATTTSRTSKLTVLISLELTKAANSVETSVIKCAQPKPEQSVLELSISTEGSLQCQGGPSQSSLLVNSVFCLYSHLLLHPRDISAFSSLNHDMHIKLNALLYPLNKILKSKVINVILHKMH